MVDKTKPEERARIKINEQLIDAGWHIADRGSFTYEHTAFSVILDFFSVKAIACINTELIE